MKIEPWVGAKAYLEFGYSVRSAITNYRSSRATTRNTAGVFSQYRFEQWATESKGKFATQEPVRAVIRVFGVAA